MKRILLSLMTLGTVGAVAFAATGAFFSDTETSTDNRFVAGDIDLKIDNESYAIDYNIPDYQGEPIGALVASMNTSWALIDLTVEKFFDFIDLKPGDYGEDTISIHVGSNDAWVCAAAQITEDADNSITEPEDEMFGTNTDGDDGTIDGDLDSEIQIAFWVDDGDNVLEDCADPFTGCVDETQSIFLSGTVASMGQEGQITLADSDGSILPDDGAIPGDSEFYIAKAWCFGNLTEAALLQDGVGDSRTPLEGAGIDCDGSGATNLAQTDSVVGDLEFYAIQARNNDEFSCSDWDPSWVQ
ncbi:hypothetical protein ACFL2V_18575 [Pseudomonadota bacterium]